MVQLATFFIPVPSFHFGDTIQKLYEQTDRQTEPNKHGLRINGQLSEILKSSLESSS